MTSYAFRAVTALGLLASSSCLGGCIGNADGEPSPEPLGHTGERVSYEEWAKKNLVPFGGTFLLEGDIGVTSEQAHKYYDAVVHPSGALYNFWGTIDGMDKWT